MSAHFKTDAVIEETTDGEEFTRYLLGEFSDEEQTQFEIQYFANPQRFAELCAWRDQLIDNYVSDGLPPALRLRFEAAIENSWMMNERIRFAEDLQQTIDRATPGSTSHLHFSARRLSAAAISDRTPTVLVIALLVIVIAAASVLFYILIGDALG
ncbi:MAG TPA: hypothetical protein VE863_18930 [Pyrinomonadaceae bacterium]|jgi:anti-sigma factor RsiW|nr:hypothetical protein [Pyrinomonadaceae bacterium]